MNCGDCILDGTDACSRGAGRAIDDEPCGDFIGAESETQETETWNGIHAQITAPKGTFDKIWEEAESEG